MNNVIEINPSKKMYTSKEFARMMQVNSTTVTKWVNTGVLKKNCYMKVNQVIRFNKKIVDEYFEKGDRRILFQDK